MCLGVGQYQFSVRITEDTAEIIDFGLRYELDEAGSELSACEGSGFRDILAIDLSPEDSSVEEMPPALQGMSDTKRQ